MSQDISLLIFKEDSLQIPESVPHFINKGVIYLPICNPTGYQFGEFISMALDKQHCEILEYKNELNFVKLADDLGIKNYIAFHSSDFGMMPINDYEFAIVENVFIKDSVWSTDGIITSENYEEFQDNYEKNRGDILLGLQIDYNYRGFLRTYEGCKFVYEKWGNRVNFYEVEKSYYQKNDNDMNKGVDDFGNSFFTGEIFKDETKEVYKPKEESGVMKIFWILVKQRFKF